VLVDWIAPPLTNHVCICVWGGADLCKFRSIAAKGQPASLEEEQEGDPYYNACCKEMHVKDFVLPASDSFKMMHCKQYSAELQVDFW